MPETPPLPQNLDLTPRRIVAELDRYIVGQAAAKRAVAIALRNRRRRLMVDAAMRDEISPKNIIMIGPTGVGKTEIARRLAKMTRSPFIKVEASKYTEVGYVGRDVESMIRELMDLAVNMVQAEEKEAMSQKAGEAAEERLLDLLLPGGRTASGSPAGGPDMALEERPRVDTTREKFRVMLHNGELDNREVEVETRESGGGQPMARIFTNMGLEDMEKNLNEAMSSLFPKKTQRRKMKIKEAWEVLVSEEAARLVDMDKVAAEARTRVEQHGMVFIDELDKVAGRENRSGPDVSREGVQRDLLPLVEGSTVPTKYGPVKTDHILFIAAGAFHVAKPSDLIPELQGRFPIRVELSPLNKEDFVRILTEPENALTIQYRLLLETEQVELEFTPEAIEQLAELACQVNEKNENIGARRLATIMEKLLDEVSFEAPDISPTKIQVTPDYVKEKLGDLVENTDLTRYIL
ncbi:MAG: ATP-dependent protease ATPase subunit HslU [Candidatus Adiutrix sp.]|jgi:ATP-dependent HslUV protease ATP-binding subunit HslU|nr:ATP-dependent protease ATPase subunit HslU [Candidatus Adiutrix sp.]